VNHHIKPLMRAGAHIRALKQSFIVSLVHWPHEARHSDEEGRHDPFARILRHLPHLTFRDAQAYAPLLKEPTP
jgi:hypothetical protein